MAEQKFKFLFEFMAKGQDVINDIKSRMAGTAEAAKQSEDAINKMAHAAETAATQTQKTSRPTGTLSGILGDVSAIHKAETSFEDFSKAAQAATADMGGASVQVAEQLKTANYGIGDMKQAFQDFGTIAKREQVKVQDEVSKTTLSLKAQGKELKGVVEMLRGGGAVAAITLVGRSFNDYTSRAVELRNMMREGKIDTSGMVGELARGIPILGEWIRGWDNVLELFTGTQEAIEKFNKETEEGSKKRLAADQAREKILADQRDKAKELAEWIRQADQRVLLANSTGAQREMLQAQQALTNTYHDAVKESGLNDAQQKVDDLKKQLESLKPKIDTDTLRAQVNQVEKELSRLKESNTAGAFVDTQTNGMMFGGSYGGTASINQKAIDENEAKLKTLNDQLTKAKDHNDAITAITTELPKAEAALGSALAAVNIKSRKAGEEYQASLLTTWKQLNLQITSDLDNYLDQLLKPVKEMKDNLLQQLKELHASIMTEEEKLQAQGKTWVDLFSKRILDKGTRDELLTRNEAQRSINEAERQTITSTGYDRTVAQNTMAYQRDYENWRQRLRDRPEALREVNAALLNELNNANARAKEQYQLAQTDFVAFVTTGTSRMVAEEETAYKQDLAHWNELQRNKTLTDGQADQARLEAARRHQERLHQIEFQQADARRQVDVLVMQSQGHTSQARLAQIDLEENRQIESWRQQYQQGLIELSDYNRAVNALHEQSARDRLAIEGTFVDGIKLGMEDWHRNMATTAEFGRQVLVQTAENISSSFGNAFADVVTGAKSAGEAFRNMAQSILSDLARMFAQRAMMNALDWSFGSGSAIGTALSSIKQFAEGGLNPYPDTGRDYVPAMLRGGEFVVRPEIVRQPGVLDLLARLNGGLGQYANSFTHASKGLRFASGGLAPTGAASGGTEKNLVVRAIVPIGNDEVARIFRQPEALNVIRKEAAHVQRMTKS